jgi:hypothetical protein
VLLYELLSGTVPFDAARSKPRSPQCRSPFR